MATKAIFDVGIDMTSLYDDYGTLCGKCIVNTTEDDKAFSNVLNFWIEQCYLGECFNINYLDLCASDTDTVETYKIFDADEQEIIKNILIDNLKINVDFKKVPNLDDYCNGVRYD